MFTRIFAMKKTIFLLAVFCLPIGASHATNNCESADRLDRILTADHRSDENKARDRYRHPAETLHWFELKPTMSVVEIWPGAGWYSEILAPYLKDCGQYYAAGFDPESAVPFYRSNAQKLAKKFQAAPAIYGQARITVLQPPEKTDIAPPNSVDRVLTFRNVHNWMKAGKAEQVFNAMYRALKPGGILGVVEHRAQANTIQDEQALSGYVSEAYVMQLATQAGFLLKGRSEINANPADSKNHPKGVWTLPPSLRLEDKDRDKYLAIGESDRMTLKFIKPPGALSSGQ